MSAVEDLDLPPPAPAAPAPVADVAPAAPAPSSTPAQTAAPGTNAPPVNTAIDDGKLVDGNVKLAGRLEGNCIHCGVPMGAFLGSMTVEGPIHNDCVVAYRRARIERCVHCDCVLRQGRTIIGGKKMHPECVADFKAKKPFVPPSKKGVMNKFAVGRSSLFGGKNWKERFFVLSPETGLAYYENQKQFDEGKSPKSFVNFTPKTRLITRPNRRIHKEAMDPSKEFIVVFAEGAEERQLLCATKSWQEHDEWCRLLECYIKIVDDPKDSGED